MKNGTQEGDATMNFLMVQSKAQAYFIMILICLAHISGFVPASHAQQTDHSSRSNKQPNIEDYTTIESYCNGAPVYSFSNLCYVYGISPDLLPGAEFQEGNINPATKIKPKKSWEIKYNLCGSEHEMTVKSPWNDS